MLRQYLYIFFTYIFLLQKILNVGVLKFEYTYHTVAYM